MVQFEILYVIKKQSILNSVEYSTYELVVCQQPLHARMCGFGEKDRRPIDPPPIVQLIVRQEGQETWVDLQ